MVYLDHAATAPVKDEVLCEMLPYFVKDYANASAAYAAARNAKAAIDRARNRVACALGCSRNEVYFTSGGTEADNWAIRGLALAHPEKRHIITSAVEHHAVLNTCIELERFGYDVTILPVDAKCTIQPETVAAAIRPDTLMVSVMLANNEVGTIEPIAEIAAAAHERGVYVHTDAVQAVGHIPVDVQKIDVDLLSLSAHKFGGPKGIGALYIRNGTRIDRLILGGAQEKGMRSGTENVPAIVGMGKAIELAESNRETAAAYICQLRSILERGLCAIPGISVNGDQENRLPGHLHVSIEQADTQTILLQLDLMGIAASAGSACSSGMIERSHVIKAMGKMDENAADVRFTIGEQNTREEMDTVVRVLGQILQG